MDQLGWTWNMDGILSKVNRLLDKTLESGKWGEYNCREPEAPTPPHYQFSTLSA